MDKPPEELLLELQSLWTDYLAEENINKKEQALKFFLYKFQFTDLDTSSDEPTATTSFVSSILEEICSFLLERVYDIISKSHLFNAPDDGSETDHASGGIEILDSLDTENAATLLKDKHNFAQLILRAPSDYSKIIALRTFLTHEIGHHLLYFLRRIDIKLLASQSSLCNLCINLFPNCQWDGNQVQLYSSNTIREFIGNLLLHQRLKINRSRDFTQSSEIKSTFNESFKLSGDCQQLSYETYVEQIRTSDEIAVVLIDLLEKCVDIETDMLLNDQSISVVCWQFAVEQLSANAEVFGSRKNAEIIKCKLLNLIGKCFNHICWQGDNLAALDLKYTMDKLMCALQVAVGTQIIFGIIYLIFGLLNNVIALSNGKLHDVLKFIDEESLDKCVESLKGLLAKSPNEIEPLFGLIVKVLLKIVDNLNKCTTSKSKKVRKKLKGNLQQHCRRNNFPCFFQKILLNIVEHLPNELQDYVLRCLHRHGICCCLCNTDTMKILFSKKIKTANRKLAFRFVHKKILTTVLMRNNCASCELKLKSVEFHKQVFELYRSMYAEVNDFEEYYSLLKHLKHISHLVSYDISTGILANIVLPIFRTYKQHSMSDQNKNRVLVDCLNIFITYLRDVRLIKAFYIEENLTHLEELLHRPEMTRSVCDLIKIGIENAAFLGDNSQEQVVLSKRLITMQLNGSATATKWFNGMLRHLKHDEFLCLDAEDEWVENNEMSALNILHIASRHWSLSFQLLKSSQQFETEFIERFDQDALIKLVCNVLCCFLLYSKEEENPSTQSQESHTPDGEIIPLDSLLSSSSALTSMNSSGLPSFDDVIKFYCNIEGQGFLERLQGNQMDESIVLFDIRNQIILPTCDMSSSDGLSMEESTSSDEQKSIFGRIFGFIFGPRENSTKASANNGHGINAALQCLCEPGDCKKLLLKLFESTIAVYIRENKGNVAEAMQKNLRKLRAIILARAIQDWNQVDTSTTAVTLALQSLLKIAELTGTFASEEVNSSVVHREGGGATAVGGADEPTLGSTESEGDYYSTRASLICADSEVDFSENDTEEFYLTADEGYEADGEIPGMSESEEEIEELWTPFTPASRYRSHVVHSGICKVVVEVLVELSVKCAQNPSSAWASSLSQLAARLFVIREFLGGPLFLLQGFAPLLQSHDVQLRDLQQSILDLVVDLNSPDVLATYFSILASKNPPVDILIKYMSYICSSTLKKQPSVELDFPMLNDGKCVSSSDPLIAEQIERVRNYHLYNHANTSFLRSACVLPITHAKLWGTDGLTVSIWMQMKSIIHHKSSSQIIEDDTKISCDDSVRTHLLSVGSNQAIISIYINGNMNLVFETSKPNAELSPKSPQANEDNNHSNSFTNKENISSNFTPTPSSSPFRNVLKQTKLVILNSFNNMHLFNGHGIADGYFEGSSVELKYYRLCRAKWTHLCFAIDLASDRFNLTVIIDGLEQHSISLPFRNVRNLTRTSTFQLLSLGDSIPKVNCNESRSTFDGVVGTPLKFSISNVILFNRKIADKEIVQNLTAMGPDFIDLTHCQVGAWKPNFGYLNLTKSFNGDVGNFHEAMKLLRESRFFTYSASEPTSIMGFDQINEGENCCGKHYGIILYGDLSRNALQSVQTSTLLCGGLSTLLYLFARVVELTSDSATQSMGLDLLLTVALSDTQLYTEFLRNDYLSLIGYVIKTDRCTKDIHLLASIVNNACTQPVILKRTSVLQVNENTISCVAHPNLIASIIHRYSDWYRSGSESSEVLEMLFKAILALVRDKHPCKDFNMKQLNRVGIIKELLNLCKVYVVEATNPVHISTEAADLFVNILSIFAGSPPSASLMDEIMKLLLLLHKPSECFVTHDRSKFYFLLSTESPIKEKVLGLQIPRRQLKQIFRERRRSSSTSLLRNAQTRRSILNDDRMNDDSPRFSRQRTDQQSNGVTNMMKDLANLESIADCSRLNKKAMKFLSPSDAGKWRIKMKRHSLHNIAHTSPKNRPQRVIRKRVRTVSKSNIDSDKRSRSDKNSDDSPQSSRWDQPKEGIKWPLENSIFTQKKSRTIFKTDFYNSVGITKLQERLFILLKDFLWLLPDNVVEEVLTHYVKVEILLVLSNHISTAVRTAILRLLSALSKRISSSELGTFSKKFYPQHLANQLAIHSTDVHMFETCLEWVTGLYGSLDAFATYESISIQNRLGLNALLSILTQTVTHGDYAAKAFQVLRTIYLTDPEDNQSLIETGLLQCCMKALHNIYVRPTVPNVNTEQAITELLTSVGERVMRSVGQMNVIWDILNMLSFYQEHNPINVVKGFRSVQGKLQLNWLNLFFKNRTSNLNFKVVSLPNSTLSHSETKTRLDLLIDRCSQFFTTFGPTYMPSDNELKLFEMLVMFGISTNMRCNNFIAWGLMSSRPLELRQFIIDTLWLSCQNEALPMIICDGKMIKSLLWLCLLEQKSNHEKPIENLEQLCFRLGIRDTDTTWNLEQELERIELNRHNTSAKHKAMLEKTIHRFESLAGNCIESSMVITRVVAELQNSERKILMNHMKEYDENYTFHKWLEIIRRMTHEGAPWFTQDRCESSFELDDTEGPSRVHTRLRRCHLDVEKRFIMEDYRSNGVRRDVYVRPLDYLISSYDQQLNISLNSQILYNFPAKYLPVDAEIDGEIIVTDHKLFFVATYRCKYFYVSCDVANITEIWLKRYQHQEKAFEIFLDTNKSLFFSLQNQDDWKIMKEVFLDKIVVCPDQGKILLMTQQWREGLLTNWEYIMTLNQIAGRTYNDLMQYPVFPWILSNYTSDVLDLTEKNNFRKLEKPIAVQHEENELHYVNNYAYINNTMTNMGSLQLKPYHYSSHYSNSGTVLHFLVRVPPFTSYFLRYQDNNFDLPDRTFHALSTTWSLASKDSPTDVKELIPEFFCLPEMFENFEGFDFGCRQSGERVEDVLLPPWCLRDPRLFVLIHRQALESEIVRHTIHHWIDLIFGHNQTGQNAVDTINVFHPATYSVFLESEITDPIERKAVETMIKTYGQMPKQLFKAAHPLSKPLNYCLGGREVIPTVKGLRWGVFLGSPQLSQPTLGNINKLPGADFLVSFNNTNMIYGLPSKSCVMQGPESDTFNVISWDYNDRIVRIQPLSETQTEPKALFYNHAFDDITCCGSDPNSNLLWCGHKSGRISVYKCSNVDSSRVAKSRQSYVKGIKLSYNSAFRKITPKSSLKVEDLEQAADVQRNGVGAELTWSGPTILIRHTDEITSICLSVEFKIAVSAGSDGIAVIWDLNDLSYVRTIERPAEIHHSPISLTAISPTLGDIVTVHSIPKNDSDSSSTPVQADECFEVTEESLDDFVNVSINPNGKSILRLHSVNARYVSHIVHEDRILAVCYSYIKEGVGVNVIATAVEGGIVRLWSSWNLSFVTEIVTGISNIKSITYSTHQHLVVLTKDSYIQVWEAEGLYGNPPKFPQIVFK